MSEIPDLDARLRTAIQYFWKIRTAQSNNQGAKTGVRDSGFRAAVTGGKQMDGFINLIAEVLQENGIPRSAIVVDRRVELPGFYRAEKQWDLLVVGDQMLIAALELKSHMGPSFGNNFNNRTEEALGSAEDIWKAYRDGKFQMQPRPFLGYLMLLEKHKKSTRPVGVAEPHFEVFPEFKGASYVKRYEILLSKLLRERLYEGASLLTSDSQSGPGGDYEEPAPPLRFAGFLQLFLTHVLASKHLLKGDLL